LNPSFFAIFQGWDVGLDNAEIVTASAVPALPTSFLMAITISMFATGALLLHRARA